MQVKIKKRQFSAACHYAYTRLALNYYMYYEMLLDEVSFASRMTPFNDRYHSLLADFLQGKRDVEALDELRNQVMAEMELLTAYTDAFQAYEYVLNRLEENFSPRLMEKKRQSSTEDEMVLHIMSYIMDSEDSFVVNERIRSVLGQLPVRFTREKFFALVEEGLSVYEGDTRRSLNDMLYVLRCESLLNMRRQEEKAAEYEKLYATLQKLRKTDFKAIEAEHYHHLTGEIHKAGGILADEIGRLMLLVDLVNDLYVLFLSRDLSMMEVSEEQRLKEILGGISDLFKNGEERPIPEEVTRLLSKLEGKQEAYYEQWSAGSLSAEEWKKMGSRKGEASVLYQIDLLLSGSAFMSLKESDPDLETVVDYAILKKETKQYCDEFSSAFKGAPRLLVRAVMAKVLSSLPLFFETIDDVQDFISKSLTSCCDEREKAVTLKLIEDMIKEDGYGMDSTL